jgi:hypothetical protein
MADCNTIDARLAKARATYDSWMNGEFVSRFTDQNGETVSYSPGGVGRLQAYIRQLEAEKAGCTGSTFAGYRGPIRFTFGRRGF